MTPALLGGLPTITDEEQPQYPRGGGIETAALAEVTDSHHWSGFRDRPAVWRAIVERIIARTMGYRYGVGISNGTHAVEIGLRAQLRERPEQWAKGRFQFVVPDHTCVPVYDAVIVGVARECGFMPKLVPIDAMPDGTMDPKRCAAYLSAHGEKVIGILPTTQYGSHGELSALLSLADDWGLVSHHDDARGAAAEAQSPKARTASVSFHPHAKSTPATGEGGMGLTEHADLADRMRALTDCGVGAGRVDPIPYVGGDPIAAGNDRMGEHTAAGLWVQYARALYMGLVARENRRLIGECLTDRFGTDDVLIHPVPDSEYPPFYKFLLLCGERCEARLGLSPETLRKHFAAQGMALETPDVPAHRHPAWRHLCVDGAYAVSDMIYERGGIIHTRYLTDERFVGWFTQILDLAIEFGPAMERAAAA